MAAVSLTRGAITAISENNSEGMKPVLQVMEVKPVTAASSSAERFRMVLSDGTHQQQAMLATQMNAIVKSGELRKGSIVQLHEFICNTIQGRRIIIIIHLEVLVGESAVIGAPQNYSYGSTTAQGRSPLPAQSSGTEQPGMAAGNPQSYGGAAPVQNMSGGASAIPKADLPYGGSSYMRNTNAANLPNPKAEPGAGSFNDSHSNANQNQRFSNPAAGGGYRPPSSTYGRSLPPTFQQPPPSYSNRGPIAKNDAPARIVPIAALNPYQGRWTIKARVTAKSDLRRYNNPRGEGKVFSFDLLDSEGGEIRVTCFNAVADQFYEQINMGKVYLISRGSLKPAQKNFNHLNNEYEIFLESTSTIQPCPEEDNTIPKQQFSFRSISEIEGMENNSTADVIGIVTSVSVGGTIMRKNGTETFKRTLQLIDTSGRSVEVTLWGNFCNNEGEELQRMCDSSLHPVLAVKAARVSDFSGKSIGTIGSSQLFINPDFPEAHKLKEWYGQEGKVITATSISRDMSGMGRTDIRKTVSQIKDEGLGRSEKPDWITVKATIAFIKVDNFCYTACPLMVGDRQCNKKVNNNGDGTWQCDRCDKSFPECDYRYLLQIQIQDHTGVTWITAFQEGGEEIIGVPAKQLYLLKHEEQNDEKFADIIRSVLFKQYMFKLKVKEETFSDEQRIKSTVVKAEKVNASSEGRYLLGLIEKLSSDDANAVPGMHGPYSSASGTPSFGYGTMENKPFGQHVTNSYGSNSGVDRYRAAPANQTGQQVNEYGSGMNFNINREAQSFCNNCNSSGHSFQNCPRAMSRQVPSGGGGFVDRSSAAMDGGAATNSCYKCKQPGHWARDCPGANAGSADGGSAPNSCFKCNQPGHWAKDCPGVNAGSGAYGSGMPGRYGNQHVGSY